MVATTIITTVLVVVILLAHLKKGASLQLYYLVL